MLSKGIKKKYVYDILPLGIHEIVANFCVKYCYHIRESICKIHSFLLIQSQKIASNYIMIYCSNVR